MLRFAVIALLFVSSTASARGSISGGGMPSKPAQPPGDYSYTCKINISYQRYGQNECFAQFEATAETSKQPDDFWGQLSKIDLSELNYRQTDSHKNCVRKPVFGPKRSRVGLSATEWHSGKFRTSLSLNISHPSDEDFAASTQVDADFSEDEISAYTSLSLPEQLQSLRVTCIKK